MGFRLRCQGFRVDGPGVRLERAEPVVHDPWVCPTPVCASNVWPTLARVCPKLMCVCSTHMCVNARGRMSSARVGVSTSGMGVSNTRGCVRLSRGRVQHCVRVDGPAVRLERVERFSTRGCVQPHCVCPTRDQHSHGCVQHSRVCSTQMCVYSWSYVQHSRGCVQLSRGCVLHACVSADVSFASRCATLKERCLPRPKSRVERLTANVEPLLIEVTVETCGGPRASGTSRSRSFPGPPSGHEPPPLATRAIDHQFDRPPGSMSPSCSAADRLFRLHRIV